MGTGIAIPRLEQQTKEIRPQAGPQERAFASDVDILGYGGAAYGGKTWFLICDPLRYVGEPDFGAVIFRRESTQITNEGGLWDEAASIYPWFGAKSVSSPTHRWTFPSGAKITFTHLQKEEDKYAHQGGQYPYIGFDEATHFTEGQVWYLIGRNRSRGQCSVRKVRLTFNPDGTSWIKRMFAPWVDNTCPIRAQPGEPLWLVRLVPEYCYFRDYWEAVEVAAREHNLEPHLAEHAVKSVTFIEADIYDNRIGMERNPGYLANLLSLDPVNRARLLYKDWNVVSDRFFSDWHARRGDGAPWHVVPTEPCPGGLAYTLGLDYGFKSPFACLLVGFDADGRALVCRELYAEGLKASEQAGRIVDMLESSCVCYDPAGRRPTEPIEMHAGHDIFAAQRGAEGRMEPIVDIYYRTFAERGWDGYISIVESGRDPVTRAEQVRRYLADWGPSEFWPQGRPGLQVMECCANLIRTLPMLKSDEARPEVVDTTQEDHAYDALGHILTSRPASAEVVQMPEERGLREPPLFEERPKRTIWDVTDN